MKHRAALVLILLLAAAPALARVGDPDQDLFGRGPSPVYAYQSPNLFIHNVGLLTLQVTNLGIIGNPYNNDLSAGFLGQEYLGQACLLVGAREANGTPRVSSSIAGTRALEMRPSQDRIDTIYPSWEGMLGGYRSGFYDPDDDGDGRVNEDFHNGKDDDGDGLIDEDFAAIGQQMFSCEYRDDTPEALAQILDHSPLGIKVRQRSFQWSEKSTNQFVGFDFAIVNVGDQTLRDVYIGMFVDGDVGPREDPGYFEDDMAGYARQFRSVNNPMMNDYYYHPVTHLQTWCRETSVDVRVAYMWDAPDEGGTSFGDAPGYIGFAFLGAHPELLDNYLWGFQRRDQPEKELPVLQTVSWTSSSAPYPDGDANTDDEWYDLLSRGTLPRTSRTTAPGDYRLTLSAGPYGDLEPGQEVHFDAALAVGIGFSGMMQSASAANMIYEGLYFDLDRDPQTGIDFMEHCLQAINDVRQVYWKDPCQDTMLVEILWSEPTCHFVNDDCDPCTGIMGKEARLKWMGFTTPPAPTLNTDPGLAPEIENPDTEVYIENPAGDRRVVLQWNNIAELRPDPLRGVNVFQGYRIYRVDNWERPSGSLGPELSDWKLLAEFRKNPRDGLGVQSPFHLRSVERRDRDLVKETTPYGPLYHIGRYEWADTAGVVNGKVYFYAVTAFSIDQRYNATTGQFEEVIVDGLPAAQQKELVMPSWGSGQSCDDIRIVPNPYRGGADWDLGPSDCDASGTRIAFRNLPEGWSRIGVYSLTGDLVFSGTPEESRVIGGCEVSSSQKNGGTFYWDLITRSGQNATSGVYLLTVESGSETCRKRFVVIR